MNNVSEPPDFAGRGVFCPQLHQVRSAGAEFAGDPRRVAPAQKGGVNKGVKAALGERFHGLDPYRNGGVRHRTGESGRATLPRNRLGRSLALP